MLNFVVYVYGLIFLSVTERHKNLASSSIFFFFFSFPTAEVSAGLFICLGITITTTLCGRLFQTVIVRGTKLNLNKLVRA